MSADGENLLDFTSSHKTLEGNLTTMSTKKRQKKGASKANSRVGTKRKSKKASSKKSANQLASKTAKKSAILKAETEALPDTPAKCTAWRITDVRGRNRTAVAVWAQEPVNEITGDMSLGELAKGTPWGTAQQIELVDATNGHDVFAPFDSVMKNPATTDGSTTVTEWEDIVWDNQGLQFRASR